MSWRDDSTVNALNLLNLDSVPVGFLRLENFLERRGDPLGIIPDTDPVITSSMDLKRTYILNGPLVHWTSAGLHLVDWRHGKYYDIISNACCMFNVQVTCGYWFGHAH